MLYIYPVPSVQIGDANYLGIPKHIIATGLVVDESVYNAENGELVSELHFKKYTEQRFINMHKAHHDFNITGAKGGSCAVSYHNPSHQRESTRGVKSVRHVTGVYATNAAGVTYLLYLQFVHKIR